MSPERKRGSVQWCDGCNCPRLFWWVTPRPNGCYYVCGTCDRSYYTGPSLLNGAPSDDAS